VDGIHDAIEFGQETWQDEYRFRCADGSYAQVLDRGLVLRDAEGRPLRMIGAMMDITERRELQARLMVADRLASVGTLAAGVAHEINNPLAYVLANLTRALRLLEGKGAAQVPELSELVREAQDGAARVRRIVQDLRVFARADDDVREQVDLRDVVRSSVHLADNEIRHRARLELVLGPIPLVDGNEGRLGQVVVNLLVNAAQAIPEGAADRNVIRVTTRVDGVGRPVLEVSDTGPGVPVEIQHRIFDPFYTTKPQSEGTGLGLTICAGIVASLGGKIELESEPGRGSTFRIVLPRATSSMKLRAAPVSPPATPLAAVGAEPLVSGGAPSGDKKRLLVVDDEPLIGKSLGFMLDDWYDVEWTTTGRDALAKVDALAAAGKAYDAILCDLMMPEMSGMDVHAELVRRDPGLGTRVVFLTGGAFTARARAFLEQIGNPTVEKPFEVEVLRAAIEAVLATESEAPRAVSAR
ncbi:MAG: response regulator, partial [Myxococcales bacterium]|nr:response regulator [Myxococcales bacterium]